MGSRAGDGRHRPANLRHGQRERVGLALRSRRRELGGGRAFVGGGRRALPELKQSARRSGSFSPPQLHPPPAGDGPLTCSLPAPPAVPPLPPATCSAPSAPYR